MTFILANKKILIFSEGFGTGHTQAAHALSVILEQQSDEITTSVVELGTRLHPLLAPLFFSAYKKTVSLQPRLYNKLYRSQHRKTLNRFSQLALHKLFYAQTMQIINDMMPDMIVCTHPFPSLVISRLKRSGLKIPLFTIITDYDAHGAWVSREVNKYFVSTINVKEKLIQHGIHSSYIDVTGIPIHPSFQHIYNLDEARLQFGLKSMPTVLVMGGGWGILGNTDLYMHMIRWSDYIQFIFCLGNNTKTLKKMSDDPNFQHANIKLLGYTKEIGKLMDISDLLVTKPGGMTCTEGMTKGIPMLFYDTISGQEEENLSYFINQGLGEKIHSVQTIEIWFSRLVENYSYFQERKKNINHKNKEFYRTNCSETIFNTLNSFAT